jgi:hypothetical protein
VLTDAKFSKQQISEVVLVGGKEKYIFKKKKIQFYAVILS